jgi:hypothetical protein
LEETTKHVLFRRAKCDIGALSRVASGDIVNNAPRAAWWFDG